jgi:hypothetical protein
MSEMASMGDVFNLASIKFFSMVVNSDGQHAVPYINKEQYV